MTWINKYGIELLSSKATNIKQKFIEIILGVSLSKKSELFLMY